VEEAVRAAGGPAGETVAFNEHDLYATKRKVSGDARAGGAAPHHKHSRTIRHYKKRKKEKVVKMILYVFSKQYIGTQLFWK
jgi:hypothetical protein